MPKDRRAKSLAFDRSRASPYPCSSSSKDAKQCKTEVSTGSLEDASEWEDTRCPICLEHPHNAVLLHCSSYENGCRPYMCDTSYRHSNCLDQYLKSSASAPTAEIGQETHSSMNSSTDTEETSLAGQVRHDTILPGQSRRDARLLQQKLMCPLCRGQIHGYVVVEAARQFMNSKVRSCSCEDCDFSGSYSELRKHARSEHPSIRPTEVDPVREHDWRRLENTSSLRDLVSAVRTAMVEVNGEDVSRYSPYDTFLSSLLHIYLFYEMHGLNVNSEQVEQVPVNRSSWRPLRFRSRETIPTPRYRLINDFRIGRTHDNRHDSESNYSRWNNHLGTQRVHYGRSNVESNHASRHNDNSQQQRIRDHRGLRWRGPQWSGSNNRR